MPQLMRRPFDPFLAPLLPFALVMATAL